MILTEMASLAGHLANAPASVNSSDVVIDLLLSAISDTARVMQAHNEYMDHEQPRDENYHEWLSEKTGVGTPDDFWQWLEEMDHFPESYDDFQRAVDIASENDPFYILWRNATGGDWHEWSKP